MNDLIAERNQEKRIPPETCGILNTLKKVSSPLKTEENNCKIKFKLTKGEVESRLKDQICTTGF